MRGQFSIEFVIDVSIILVLVIFLLVFFGTFSNTHYNAAVMNSACSEIAQGINLVASSGGLSLVQYIPLLNDTTYSNYNISVSDGIIIMYLQTNGKPSSLIANTNIVSCGANTRNTINESFGLSNLAVYPNSTGISIAYLYSNNTNNTFPTTVFGGNFPGGAMLYLRAPGGVSKLIATEPSSFVYSNATMVEILPPGSYKFYAESEIEPSIHVILPFTKS